MAPGAHRLHSRLPLHSQGAANTLERNGTLSPVEPADHFAYDPRNPAPTCGGGLCCHAASLAAGAFDQRKVECRQDVLVYTPGVLESGLEVTGPLQVVLHVATSAVDTDWTAKLVDVYPCGVARNLADGITRARYQLGTEQSSFVFERHPNTAQPVASEEEMVVAEQRVCHDALHPSQMWRR